MSSPADRRVPATLHANDARARYALLARATTDIIVFTDRATMRIVDANAAAEQAYGYTRAELIGKSILELRDPSTVPDTARLLELCDQPGGLTFESEHIRRSGETFPVEIVSRTVVSQGETMVVSTIRDITQRRHAATQVDRLARLLLLTMKPYTDEPERILEILALSTKLIRERNAFFVRLRQVKRGSPGVDWPETISEGGVLDSDGFHARFDALCASIVATDDVLADDDISIDASGVRQSVIGAPIRVGPLAYALVFNNGERDRTGRFREADRDFVRLIAACIRERLNQIWLLGQMKFQSENDPLTALPNRTTFRAQVNAAIAQDGTCTLAVVDIDGFRHVNTTHGRQTADALLVEVGARLEHCRHPDECVGRIGSDSFGVLLRNDRDFIATRVEKLRAAFNEPFGLGDRDGTDRLGVTAGIGVARGSSATDTFEKLLLRADTAVAVAKSRENGGVAFSSPEQAQAITDADVLRTELRHAIANDELEMFVQPYVELASMRITAAEALVRWNHPTRGLLAPAHFIHFAERSGLIRELGMWVTKHTIEMVASLDTSRAPGLRVSFNVSATELIAADFAERVAVLLKEYPGVEARLGIEVTESVAMRDVGATAITLAELRLLGLHIAIDDFGTGYSSLAYLSRLPVNALKLDQTFIAKLSDEQHGAALVKTFISIAGEFGYDSIAEGVETEAQLDWLRDHGCTMAQGFFIAHPMQVEDFRTLLSQIPHRALGGAEPTLF